MKTLTPSLFVLFVSLTTLAYGQNARWKHQPVLQTSSQAQPNQGLPDVDTSDPSVIPGEETEEDILNLDLESLGSVDVTTSAPSLNLEVSSVDRSVSTVGKSPAAIFVITNEMIQRSGAKSIPEALRMAPGVHVARVTSNKWAISIRGFNNVFANSLLVQIDGRSVYNPLFAGVYWDVQDLVLEDVDRIEIIRGPGATIWGANAVNGIINVITKSSKDTQGVYVQAGAGTEWDGFGSARYGGTIGDNATYRIWGKWFERDTSQTVPGFPDGTAGDSYRLANSGFRLDWDASCCDNFMLQGAHYEGFSGAQSFTFNPMAFPLFQTVTNASDTTRGSHILGRWTRRLSDESDWSLQFYYDQFERRALDPTTNVGHDRDTIDVDFQYRFPLGDRHAFICGFGYRFTEDFVRNSATTSLTPHVRPLDRFGYFIQDRITLSEDFLYFTIGSKFSHNDYTQFEMQPSMRLLMTPNEQLSVWGSVSRAVRTPSRIQREGLLSGGVAFDPNGPMFPPPPMPLAVSVVGNNLVQSEEVLAYEFGMRGQPTEFFYWDVAAFYNDYTDLAENIFAIGPGGLTLTASNSPTHEQTWGFELVSTLDVTEDLQLRGGYSFFRGRGTLGPEVFNYPRNMFYLQSSMELTCDVSLDLIGRYADSLGGAPIIGTLGPPVVPSYFEMDARLAYRPYDDVEFFLVGRNLLDQQHNEWVSQQDGLIGAEVPREVYTGVNIRY